MASILLHTCSKTLKYEKVYGGKDCRTEDMRVVLPACDSNFAFHPCSLELSFSIKN